MQSLIDQLIALNENHWYISYIAVLIICVILYSITSKVLLATIDRVFKRTSTQIDDILLEKKVFNKLPYLIPLVFIYNLEGLLPNNELIDRIVVALIFFIILLTVNALINALGHIYDSTRYAKKFNIKSYIQITKLILNIFGLIIFVAILIGRSPVYLLSGIGALTAVLLLVFKDTILSLVSSVQITSNDLFKIGDWVEAPQFGADGDVIDIALHSVKIQNWDKTISIIPTNKLIDSSFKNWRGMSDSGGRRIKRSIMIDMNSIKFCSDKMIERYRKFNVISDYISRKLDEIEKHNSENNIDEDGLINGRSLTNIGTFRAYIEGYLRGHNKIHKEMTFLVRQLSPSPEGLPLEIYVFSNDTDWINYEAIQSDIFDHLLAVLNEFDLKVFQNPTGNDFNNLNANPKA